MFVDSPPNSHYDRLIHPPLSYTYPVPVTDPQMSFRASRQIEPGDGTVTLDSRECQRPLPPIPQESGHGEPDNRWIEMCGNRQTGQSQWYYRADTLGGGHLTRAASDSDLLELAAKRKISYSNWTRRTPKKTFHTLSHLPGRLAASLVASSNQEPRPTVGTRRYVKMAAALAQQQRSFTLESSACGSRAQPPRNPSLRRKICVGSGLWRCHDKHKQSEPTSSSTLPAHRNTKENRSRMVRCLILPPVLY